MPTILRPPRSKTHRQTPSSEPDMDGQGRPERVLLVSMPFGPVERPSLGLGLLHAHCMRLGVECETRYLNLDFAELVGANDYLWVTEHVPYTAFSGDWIFAEQLYGPRPDVDERYVRDVLRGSWRLEDGDVERLSRIRGKAGEFLDRCCTDPGWQACTLVGFTSVFQQNIASLALAARLKVRYPHLTIAFGGANWEEPMGSTLRRLFPFVDLAFSGEADRSWPAVLLARRDGQPVEAVPGVSCEGAGGPPVPVPALIEDLDEVPIPNFDPYFQQLRGRPALAGIQPVLLLETARGCWWGERSQCTFCGLNGSAMAFRSKSPDRAVTEIATLRQRYDVGTISVVDDILDMRYFRTVLPELAERRLAVDLFWEVKASLTYKQVAQLKAAGVRFIQPGVESLSDHVLDLMRKGTTAARNIELLKWCVEFGVTPLWNLLYGFPGETRADYDQTADIITAIWHLPPPTGYGPIRLDRFSPYHVDPASYGMVNVRPMDPLPDLYPFDEPSQASVAYYFDFDYGDGRSPAVHAGAAVELARQWMSDDRRGSLWMRSFDSGLHIVDSRRQLGSAPRHVVLHGWRAAVYLACDRAQDMTAISSLAQVQDTGTSEDEIVDFLERACGRQLMLHLADRWLNLAVHTPCRPFTPPLRTAGSRQLAISAAQ